MKYATLIVLTLVFFTPALVLRLLAGIPLGLADLLDRAGQAVARWVGTDSTRPK